MDVHLADGLVRQYSLCGSPSRRTEYRIAVKLEPHSRGGSWAVHRRLAVASRLRISAPRNLFSLDEQARHSILVAGGIGVTPLLSMAHRLSEEGLSYEFHYFGRSREQMAFAALLESGPFAGHGRLHVGLGTQDGIRAFDALLSRPDPGKHVYVCGPKGFMTSLYERAAARGWASRQLHSEHFGASELATDPAGDSSEVVLARSGLRVPASASMADALRAAGVPVATSCEQGVCGTCVTHVLADTPDHRDLFLSDEERAAGTCIALCVSRARTSELVLDL